MSLKTKILLLVLIPLILISILLTAASLYQSSKLGERNLQSFSDTIYQLRRNELKNYTELALSSVQHLTDDRFTTSDKAQLQRDSTKILRNLRYGEDGYFFVYDYNGVNITHPTVPSLEGKNLIDMKDSNGTEIIRGLVENAQNEGGFTDYIWDKPSLGRDVGKISYADGVQNWEWMVGTGLYVDDLELAVSELNEQLQSQLKKSLLITFALGLFATILVGLIGARFTVHEGQIADKKLKALSYKSIAGQEEERRRIAHELQSSVTNKLVSVRKDIKLLIDSDVSSALNPGLSKLDKKVGSSVLELFKISGSLNPEVLEKHGLNVALKTLAEEVTKESGVVVKYSEAGSVSQIPLEVATALYRTSQQALKNIVEHADVQTADLRCILQKDMISITISDKGKSFDYDAYITDSNKRLGGLLDMQIRTESLGGTFNVFVSKGNGTIIKVRVPL